MSKTGSLLLVSILAVALLAPPARSQSRKVTLEEVATDVINLRSYIQEMQRTADAKNAETKALLDQILGRFTSIDSRLQTLTESLSAIKTADEKSAKELEETKVAMKALKDNIDKLDLGQGVLDIKSALRGLKDQFNNLQNTETSSLPTARQAYDSAYSLFNQGFYEDAIVEFRDVVKGYPKDSRAAKAQLNIGTAYYNQRKFDQALIEFDKAIQDYPESDTKCTALYKKGLTFKELKKPAEARAVFQSVVKDCPTTTESGLATLELGSKPAASRGARGQ
jgi:tol-pal system protein YbgF